MAVELRLHLIDTSILIDHLRGSRRASEFLAGLIKADSGLVISVVTVGELFAGESTRILSEYEKVANLLFYFQIVNLTYDIAQKAGELRRNFKISLLDAFIAATALKTDAVLVSKNKRDFEKVRNLELKIV